MAKRKECKEKYFAGGKLIGDDFGDDEIKKWYYEEKESFDARNMNKYTYPYHKINKKYGFNKINKKFFNKVLCFGGGPGQEILPVSQKCKDIYVIEPSDKYKDRDNTKLKYLKPAVSGKIKFPENTFDLITCLGVLHHIPNVSFVFSELIRVLKPGGYLLLREPTVSLGDWNKKRDNLTKNERGIPLNILNKLFVKNSAKIIAFNRIFFPLIRKISILEKEGFEINILIEMDYLLSKIFSFNKKYHCTKFYEKLQPQNIYAVLTK